GGHGALHGREARRRRHPPAVAGADPAPRLAARPDGALEGGGRALPARGGGADRAGDGRAARDGREPGDVLLVPDARGRAAAAAAGAEAFMSRPEISSRVGIGSERGTFGGSAERRAAAGEAGAANVGAAEALEHPLAPRRGR